MHPESYNIVVQIAAVPSCWLPFVAFDLPCFYVPCWSCLSVSLTLSICLSLCTRTRQWVDQGRHQMQPFSGWILSFPRLWGKALSVVSSCFPSSAIIFLLVFFICPCWWHTYCIFSLSANQLRIVCFCCGMYCPCCWGWWEGVYSKMLCAPMCYIPVWTGITANVLFFVFAFRSSAHLHQRSRAMSCLLVSWMKHQLQ